MKALVYAYKRPELTREIVVRINKINTQYQSKYYEEAISQIILVHDGIREEESDSSERSHRKTRELCLYLEETQPKVSTLIFENNVGLTNHMFRIVSYLEEDVGNFILIEEDKAPTLEGVEFLIQNSRLRKNLSLLDTLPMNKHTSQSKILTSTLFTDNGNIVISESCLELAKRLWAVKDKYQSDFNKNLFLYFSSFLSGYPLNRALRYYSNYFSWGLVNLDRPDSLLAYTLILEKQLKHCPQIPLSENWSARDTRGKNVNSVPINRGLTCECTMIQIWGMDVCPKCEMQGTAERVALDRFGAIRSMLEFKARKLLYKTN